MPTTKIRLSDFAADLNLPVQEIIDRLKTLDEKAKNENDLHIDKTTARQ